MIRPLIVTFAIVAASCGTPSVITDSGPLPTGCSMSVSGESTGTFVCAAAINGPSSTMLRVQNLAMPPTQPLSVQVVCSSAQAIAPGTYAQAMTGGNGGCITLVQEFLADASIARMWRADQSNGSLSVVITAASMDGGMEVHGSFTATAVETNVMNGMPITGHDLMLTGTF